MTDRLTEDDIDTLERLLNDPQIMAIGGMPHKLKQLCTQAKLAAQSPPVAALPEEPIVVVNRGDSYAVIAGYSKNAIATFQKHCGEMAESYAVGYDSGRESMRAAASGVASENQRLDKEVDKVITQRDRAQDALRDAHLELGGDGEWTGKLPPQQAPDSGDLHLDVPALAKEVFNRASAAEASAQSAVARVAELERALLGQFADVQVGDYVRCRVTLGDDRGIVKELCPLHRMIKLESGWCLHQKDALVEHKPAAALKA